MADKRPAVPGKKSDKELILLTLKDKENYRLIVERYKQPLIGYVRRISRLQLADAKDILQEVFLKAYRNLNAYDQTLKFSSWLYRIAHNETVSYIRKIKARPQTIDLETNQTFLEAIESKLNLEKELDQKLLKRNLKILLDKLDEKYRVVLILRYLEEKNYEEIADILQKPTGTVATLLNRAKENFKKEIAKGKNETLIS